MSAAHALEAVRQALDGRRVIWFGIRGEDGEALLQLPELEASFSVTAPLRSARLRDGSNVTLESISGARPDLDRHDIDLDHSEAATEFKRMLLAEVSSRCVVVTYRSAAFVSALGFSMTDTMTVAGLFKDRQQAFEHKPWVETSLARRGVHGLGWTYVSDEHHSRAKRLLAEGPVVLRASRSSGGVGMTYAETEEDVDQFWPSQPDTFVAVAPFVTDAVPVNLTGCVFANGVVRVHPPSVQLIGIESCTDRRFGYAGNDFGAIRNVDSRALDRLDSLTLEVGAWLHEERYLGVFGVDALCRGDEVFFTEINPRFQGSSALSAEVAAALDVPDIYLDHVAATLGLAPEERGLSAGEWAMRQPQVSHIVVHNISGKPVSLDLATPLRQSERNERLAQVLPVDIRGLEGAALFRVVLDRSVTETGFELDAASSASVDRLISGFSAITTAEGTLSG